MLSAQNIGLRQGDGVASIEVMSGMATEVESIILGSFVDGSTYLEAKVVVYDILLLLYLFDLLVIHVKLNMMITLHTKISRYHHRRTEEEKVTCSTLPVQQYSTVKYFLVNVQYEKENNSQIAMSKSHFSIISFFPLFFCTGAGGCIL